MLNIIISLLMTLCVCACACVCVPLCVCACMWMQLEERQREGERHRKETGAKVPTKVSFTQKHAGSEHLPIAVHFFQCKTMRMSMQCECGKMGVSFSLTLPFIIL